MIASAHAESVASPVDDVVSMTAYNCLLSANYLYRIPNLEMRLPTDVVMMEYSIGPRIKPCGTPKNNFTVREWQMAMPTDCSRPARYERSQ